MLISQFNLGEIKQMLQDFKGDEDSERRLKELFELKLQEKGVKLPQSKTEFDTFIAHSLFYKE